MAQIGMGERIRAIRKFSKLTQSEFSEKISVKRASITHYETGKNTPSTAVINNICREFHISEEWLLHGTGEMFVANVKDELKELLGRRLEDYKCSDEAVTELLSTLDPSTKVYIFEAIHAHNMILSLLPSEERLELKAQYLEKVSSLMMELNNFFISMDNFSLEYDTEEFNREKLDLDYRQYEARSKKILMDIFDILSIEEDEEELTSTIPSIKEEKKKAALVKEQQADYQVGIVGDVAAGEPIMVYNHMDDLVDVPGSLTVDYVLNVKGQSMVPTIADGSLVFVKQQDDLDQGDIGIFMIDDTKVTCKRYHRSNGNVVLRSENKDYPDMVFGPKSNIRILGKVVLTTNV